MDGEATEALRGLLFSLFVESCTYPDVDLSLAAGALYNCDLIRMFIMENNILTFLYWLWVCFSLQRS